MILIDLTFVLLFALILSSFLGWGLGWRHPARGDALGHSLGFLFVILMLSMWAGSSWLPPWGPVWHGTPWLNLLLIGSLVSALLLATVTPARRPRSVREATEQEEKALIVGSAFGLFFWLLIIGLIVVIVAHYMI